MAKTAATLPMNKTIKAGHGAPSKYAQVDINVAVTALIAMPDHPRIDIAVSTSDKNRQAATNHCQTLDMIRICRPPTKLGKPTAQATPITHPRRYIGERDKYGKTARRPAKAHGGPRRHTARTSLTLPASWSRLNGLGRKWMSDSSDTLSRKLSSA